MSAKVLDLVRLGNPILRSSAQAIPVSKIKSSDVQKLIANIRHTNKLKEYGVGLAAPQVGVNLALSVIGIKPTPTRPHNEIFETVIINPEYSGIGRRSSMWEGCQSIGSGDDTLYAQVPRYKKIKAGWYDEHADHHETELSEFVAHVFQHETDHLNGILFIDKVKDRTTYMMADEYRKRIIKK